MRPYTSRPVADLPFELGTGLDEQLARILDVEGKIPRAIEALGPVEGRDVVVGLWSAFRAAGSDDIAAAARLLRPRGRLLIVHDYGRDDVAELCGSGREYGAWTYREDPFLGSGFKIRVLHCWWTFSSVDEARTFLEAGFGVLGRAVADRLTRPRLSYNVAVYHRTLGEESA